MELGDLLKTMPVLPYIRHAKVAVRDPWHIPIRRLLDYLLMYVQEGRCIVQLEDEKIILNPGDFCLIQPNTIHSLHGETHTVTPFIHMDFFYNPQRENSFPTRPGQVNLEQYKQLIQPTLNHLQGIHIPVKFSPGQPTLFRDTFTRAIDVWERQNVVHQLEAQLLATELIVQLIRDHVHVKSHKITESLSMMPSFLSLHLSEPITIEDMAREARLSASHFAAIFVKQFRMTPHQYLLKMRIDHACELLLKTETTQQLIAEYCGFADVHHFSKKFKQVNGRTPGQYRKKG